MSTKTGFRRNENTRDVISRPSIVPSAVSHLDDELVDFPDKRFPVRKPFRSLRSFRGRIEANHLRAGRQMRGKAVAGGGAASGKGKIEELETRPLNPRKLDVQTVRTRRAPNHGQNFVIHQHSSKKT